MVKKEFTYRGKTLDELQKMSLKEFAVLLPSTKRRSVKRGLTDRQKKVYEDCKNNKSNIKTHARGMIIFPLMIGRTILVHSGKVFEAVRVEPEMIGHRLGEFVLTREKVEHSAPGIGATKSTSSISVK
jgi:small subunit ribosomal protein S19